jgi:elongation factor P
MLETADFKKGLKLLLDDNQPYQVVDFQHVKPGKGNQFTRCKIRNLLTGQLYEKTYKSGEKFGVPNVEHKEMTFLYKDDNGFNFMDQVSFEQLCMHDIAEASDYLTENMTVNILIFNEKAISVEVPKAVHLKVVKTDPGVRGNTVSGGGTKPATLQTGLTVTVPLHINEGDTLRIDTSTGDYVERVNLK